MDISSERRFQSNFYSALKKRLDALHYAFPLSLESSQLVERLLSDLLKTTEGFQQLKKTNQDLSSRLRQSQDSIDPLKRETGRLLQQNNDLHLELMKVKEDCDARENSWRASVKKLEGENYDLKFLIQKSKSQILKLESENLALREKVEQAMSKMYLPSSSKGLAHARKSEINTLGNTQSFEVSRQLNNTEIGNPQAFQRQHAEWANELRVADERARRWQEELQAVNKAKSEMEYEIDSLKSQIMARDIEIKRISNVITDFNVDKLTAQYKEDSSTDTIRSLNQRIDYLNKENLKLTDDLQQLRHSFKKSEFALEENKTLIDRVNQLRTKNQQYQSKLKELEAMSNQIDYVDSGEYKRAQGEINELRDIVRQLQQELKSMSQQSENSNYIQAAYNSDKKAYNEAIESINQQKYELQQQLNNTANYQNELVRENKTLKEELNLYRVQSQNLQKQLEMAKQYSDKITQENIQTESEQYSLKQKIQDLENEKAIQDQEIINLRHEIERLEKLKSAAEDHLQQVREEIYKTKTSLDSTNSAKQRIQVLQESNAKEIEIVKEDNRKLNQQHEEDHKAYIELERRLFDKTAELSQAQESVKIVQMEHQQLSQELGQKLEEVRDLERIRLSLERELAELRPIRDKIEQFNRQINQYQEAASEKEMGVVRLKRELEGLQFQLKSKDDQIQELNQIVAMVNKDKNSLNEQIAGWSEKTYAAESQGRRAEQYQYEINNLREQLNTQFDNERVHLRQIEQLKSEVQREQDKVLNANKQYERVSQLNKDLNEQILEIRDTLNGLSSQGTAFKSEKMMLEEQKLQYTLQIDDLKRQLSTIQGSKFRLEDEVSKLQDLLKKESQQNAQLSEQVNYLKSLTDNYEKIKEDLLQKLQQSQHDRYSVDEKSNSLYNEIAQLRKSVNEKDQMISELQEALKNLDKERDYLQGLLDQKDEENAAILITLQNSKAELNQLKENLLEFQNKESSGNKRIKDKDYQIQQLQEKAQYYEQISNELKAQTNQTSRNTMDLQEQVKALTRENQIVNEQLIQTTQEKNQLYQANEENKRSEKLAQQLVRNSEREKEDLRLTYSKACEENDRLTQAVTQISNENSDLYSRVYSADQEVLRLQQYTAQQDNHIQQLQYEIQTLESQITNLTYQIENSEKRAREALQTKDEMLMNYNASRHVTSQIESSKEDLQRQVAELQYESQLQQSRARTLNNELTAVQQQLEIERQKYNELEQVLIRERNNMAMMHREYSSRNEYSGSLLKDTSRSSFETPDRSMDSMQNKLDNQRTEILNLEMECLKLKDENSKTLHMLKKSDDKVKELESEVYKTRSFHSSRDE